MFIAREKKKDNIAEYILYMWQVEDLLRALGLNMEQVDKHIVAGFGADEQTAARYMIGTTTSSPS